MKKVYKLPSINLDNDIKTFVKNNINQEKLDILSRISNGPGGCNISDVIKINKMPEDLKSLYKKQEEAMLISFYHVAWHDDKDFATKTYPWFLVIVAETHGKEFYLEMGKRGKNKTKTLLKNGDVYLINTQIKHRVSYNGKVDGKPCSIIVDNTVIRDIDIEKYKGIIK